MVIEIGKPSYYFLLKKRRQKLVDILTKNEINTKKDFDNFCKGLNSEFLLTEEFYKEAEEYLKSVSTRKAATKPSPVKNKDDDKKIKSITDPLTEPQAQFEPEPEPQKEEPMKQLEDKKSAEKISTVKKASTETSPKPKKKATTGKRKTARKKASTTTKK